MTYFVVFSPEASEDLLIIYRHIAKKGVACDRAALHRWHRQPLRTLSRISRSGGPPRRHRPGLHITNYQGRVVIAFAVDADQVSIIGVYDGGRDYESLLQSDLED